MAVLPTLPLPASTSGSSSSSGGDGGPVEGEVLMEITSPLAWGGGASLPIPEREVETCGMAYFEYQRKRRAIEEGEAGSGGYDQNKKKKKAGAAADGGEEEEDDDDSEADLRFSKKALTPKDVKNMDYYSLLGMGHLPMNNCTPDLIKKAYRKALLLYHPDKTGRGDRDEVFIEVQKAYETLSDERKKRAYDSEMNFDESIPTGREKGDFYKVYAPVFDRNGRFAVKRPVPPLGNADSPIEDVYRFYDYWGRFESWRDFSLKAAEENECNLEEAASREEKRWMQKENDKTARAMKKEEYKRLAKLVDLAKANDPRLKQAKELEKQRKEQLKAQRVAEQKKKQEAAAAEAALDAKKKEEEEARLKEERAQAKVLRDQSKKRMRFARSRFRALCTLVRVAAAGSGGPVVSPDDEDFVYEVLDVVKMEEAVAALEGVPYVYNEEASPTEVAPDGVAKVKAIIAGEKKKAEARRQEEETANKSVSEKQAQAQAEAAAAAAKKEVPWTEDELGYLAKAVVRFPAGTQKRWQIIADYINHMLKGDHLRTKEECIKQYQVVQATPGKAKAIAAIVGSGTPTTTASFETKAPAKTEPAAEATAAASGGGGGDGGGAGGGTGGWSQEQQKQLEAGLVKYPTSMDKNERWKAIAEGVEGKSKKECAERYKQLRAALQKKKEAKEGAK